MSTFGEVFRVTTFGESHCKGVGAVIDGCPPMLALTEEDIQPQLSRRRPGQSRLTTPRSETDIVTILSGTEGGVTLGTPIGLFVPNENVRPGDYSEMSLIPRPGHADYVYQAKYGIRAASGGGRSSARETIGRVAAGAVAEKWLREEFGTTIVSFVSSIGPIDLDPAHYRHESGRPWTREEVDSRGQLRILRSDAHWKRVGDDPAEQARADAADEAAFLDGTYGVGQACYEDVDGVLYDREGGVVATDAGSVRSDDLVTLRCPHPATASRMATLIRQLKAEKDSTGGVLSAVVGRVPVGLGEPCFDKLEARLAAAMLSLPATKGFEIGTGFAGTRLRGSEHNDVFASAGGAPAEWEEQQSKAKDAIEAAASASSSKVHPTMSQGGTLLRPRTNHAGGTLGGISTGADIEFRVAIKPVSTIGRPQLTAGYDGKEAVLEARGRHDPCVLPRAGPLVEGMTALVLADLALIQRTRRNPTVLPPDLSDY
jgi:chorismate synthase